MAFLMAIESEGRAPCPIEAPPMIIEPKALPNEPIAERSESLSPDRFLKRASSRQIKRGMPSSSTNERASSPNLRASENRSSSRADGEGSALSLHQSGQAASMAESLRPSCFSCCLRRPASVVNQAPPHHSLGGLT